MSLRYALWIVPLVVLLAPATTEAQVIVSERGSQTTLSRNVFGLGFEGGPTTGLGLSFRHHLPSPFSYQIVGGVLKATDRLFYSVGTELEYDLSRTSAVRFYAATAFAYFYSGISGHNDMVAPTRVGVGIGAEGVVGGGFHINGDLLFTFFSDGTVLPLPQIGLYYYFY